MPNPKARDPHTIAFLRDGRLFFTVQAGNFIGTLDPKVPGGAIKLVESPTANSRPYGVRLDSKGVPFSTSSTLTRSPAPIRRRWSSASTRCRTRTRGRGASRSARTTPCHTAITRLPRSSRSEDRQGRGVPVARRRRVDAVRDRRHRRRRRLVRRDRRRSEERAGAVQPRDEEVPDLAGARRRRHGPQHGHRQEGNLWLAESGVGKIARVTISGRTRPGSGIHHEVSKGTKEHEEARRRNTSSSSCLSPTAVPPDRDARLKPSRYVTPCSPRFFLIYFQAAG